jgi:hypothetical protein
VLQQLNRLVRFEGQPQQSIAFSCAVYCRSESRPDLAAGREEALKNGGTFRGEYAGYNFYLMI